MEEVLLEEIEKEGPVRSQEGPESMVVPGEELEERREEAKPEHEEEKEHGQESEEEQELELLAGF